jgi:FtsP/CotA-like multicopper oxidase with cupredoxin domain
MFTKSRFWATQGARGFAVILTAVLAVGTFAGMTTRDLSPIPTSAQPGAVALTDLPIELGGSRTPHPAATGQVRAYEIVAAPTRWEVLPGVGTEAYAYNGQVPGPTIRVTEGDTLRVTLRNELDEPTSIHWHGLHVPNAMDGVPPLTQEAVEPGASFTYEFPVSHAGTFMYHSHTDAAEQIGRGLYGPLIVDPQPGTTEPTKFDQEFTMMLSAWNISEPTSGADEEMASMPGMEEAAPADAAAVEEPGSLAMQMDYNYFTINGKAFPAAAPWQVHEGDLVRVRVINISNLAHPMHLHGQDFKLVAKDGEPLRPEQQLVMNTLSVDAGETYDIVFVADELGTWVFHCHELHHTENDGVEPGGLIQVIETAPSGTGAEAS